MGWHSEKSGVLMHKPGSLSYTEWHDDTSGLLEMKSHSGGFKSTAAPLLFRASATFGTVATVLVGNKAL